MKLNFNLDKNESLGILWLKLNLNNLCGWIGCISMLMSLVSGIISGWCWFLRLNVEPYAVIVFVVTGLLGLALYGVSQENIKVE